MKLVKYAIATIPLALLTACANPPASPEEGYARRAAGAELVAKQCAGYAGGYDAVRELKKDASKNIATARELGADDAMIAKARSDVDGVFSIAEAFTNRQQACNQMIGQLAWVE
ncbi:hypothetical protein N9563_01150 [bacterium]|nr:hypothetical protein [bacterium]